MHGSLNAGRFSLALRPLSLQQDVLLPVWALLRAQSGAEGRLAGLSLSQRVAPAVPDRLMGDPARLIQTVLNLLRRVAAALIRPGAYA